ncbi:isochorismatase family protein [Dermacoccus abyssi]
MPPLVDLRSPSRLLAHLAEVAAGEKLVLQAGDCAEDPAECGPDDVDRKVVLVDVLGDVLAAISDRPVVRVGRIAGQFAKPRSAATERVGDTELPSYRGHIVNGPEFNQHARRPDPKRLLSAHRAASQVMRQLKAGPGRTNDPVLWTSHEALLLDYEVPMLRRDDRNRLVLASTHWPWIGERTRHIDSAHVHLLANVINPVACKVGPRMTVEDLLALCARLDPSRRPGRLTLIARLGAHVVGDRLPALVKAVHAAGHPAIWLCDPMHANTVATADGRKTRLVQTIVAEVTAFQAAVIAAGGTPGGLHLETTPNDVTECADTTIAMARVGDRYTTLCDPRLNALQAVSVVSTWRARKAVETGGGSMTGLTPITAYPLPTKATLPTNTVPWTIDPERAVLLIHDMQRYFLAPFPAEVRDPLVRNCARLRTRCADLGLPVTYTAQPGGMTEEQRGLLKDFWGPGMRVDPSDRLIVDELSPAPTDTVLTKWRYSAFFRSDLLTQMREQGRDQLILCGVYAHVGVLMTAVDAFTNDIQPFLVADALGDFSAEHHRMAIDYAAARAAMVTTTEEVLR